MQIVRLPKDANSKAIWRNEDFLICRREDEYEASWYIVQSDASLDKANKSMRTLMYHDAANKYSGVWTIFRRSETTIKGE